MITNLKGIQMKKTLVTLTLTCSLLLLASMVQAQRKEPKKTEIRGHTMYTLLKPGDIPAIFDPEFYDLKEAENFYYADEPLLVVSHNGETKGYSTWHLDHHEIVNDYIKGTAITVTW